MTQLLPASERSRSACRRGSATMTMVPSSVDINCMPVIAKIAMPSTCVVRLRAEWSVDSLAPPTADMACQPTHERIRRDYRRSAQEITPESQGLQVSVVDRVLDFLRVRDLLGGIADE